MQQNLSEITRIFKAGKGIKTLLELLEKTSGNIHIQGTTGSACALITAIASGQLKKQVLAVLPEKEEAAYFYNDLITASGQENIYFFPSTYRRSVQYDQVEPSNIVLRTEVLNNTGSSGNPLIIVTYPEALIEKVIDRNDLLKNTLILKENEEISPEFLHEILVEYEFERVDFVYEPGQYSVRGSIIDVFSFAGDQPYRIDFAGNKVDSIRTFEIETQMSIDRLPEISIIPDTQKKLKDEKRVSFFNFIQQDTILFIVNPAYIIARMEEITDRVKETEDEFLAASVIQSGDIQHAFSEFRVVEFSGLRHFKGNAEITMNISRQPSFSKNFDLLADDIKQHGEENYQVFLLSENERQIERLHDIFSDKEQKVSFIPVLKTLHEGFIDHDLRICCYTDHQIFDRYHRFRLKDGFGKKATVTINELNSLQPGDYIVHIDHGIGIFGGLEKIEVNGKIQEAIKLVYKDLDTLFVNIHSLHKISKYKGKEGETPKIYKLGSGAWQKLKQSTKSKVRDIARELIILYAKRKEQTGFGFSPDSYLNQELEASFLFEDTPDQVKATSSVREDMESDSPMDRLICGDVGFGKTEIAVRAAFKAVCDSKQVAILVPTTILALQHYNTFTERLKDFPCSVDYYTRLRPAKKQTEILKGLSDGRIDIIIGTHKLVSKNVHFKDIGLLIIDEEQKFGVAVKEKLKQIRINVDTLTLTATPIPRTLQFSLMGARDLSILQTPPPNRHPIITELHIFNEDIIREAINYEINRGGQVFFINNRIQNISDIELMVNRLCPGIKTAIAHGQMEGTRLEKVMLEFIEGYYGVLIATSIIENGLDIPNANTIIINDAQNFGLSDLHQLRGRVGRSNKKAFCYLLAPPLTLMTNEARRRLKAIEEYSELGSGFNISLQDLDIRGAGNLLGAEQSGFIADIGFETYHKILDEAIHELKESEFRELLNEDNNENTKHESMMPGFVNDCSIDTDLELLFPEDYIYNISERIRLYRKLDATETEESLLEFEKHLVDRFGPLPVQSSELLNVVRLRRKAKKLGFEKIILKNGIMICYFVSNQDSPYYHSGTFRKILSFVQNFPREGRMKESTEKLSLTFSGIATLKEASAILDRILNHSE